MSGGWVEEDLEEPGSVGNLTKRSRSWSRALFEVETVEGIEGRVRARRRERDESLARLARRVERSDESGSLRFWVGG